MSILTTRCTFMLTTYTVFFLTCIHLCSQGAGKDIQQLFTAIDRRIEALKRNVTTDQDSEEGAKPTSTKSSQNTSFDEEDKESILDHHSSPESSPEPPDSSTRTRLIPVPILTTSPSPATQATPTVTMVTNSNSATMPQMPTTSPPTSEAVYPEDNESRRHSRKTLLRRSSSSTSDKDSESIPSRLSSERSPCTATVQN